ncbi:hypothetical protein E6C70_12575 [Glaciibacter flavus]|uniref:LssY-like C-terminal domain-containing protein n=1 Tax=Orlajensenia flava TaxID=2565934 RepID=A0A4S4FPV8_9MICO|nr:LssY C-terminal domain-containing protein [Glaciibacter flavus]THG32580.1 hypothetical protein E6C70_12575 [Glaciibacter flavus]
MAATQVVGTTDAVTRPRRSFTAFLDGFFFVFAALAAIWLATIVFNESFQWRWSSVVYFVAFWVLLAYLLLPRVHRILTTIYVPDYFIGRARTSDGLLGDPVNLALLGSEEEVNAAMVAAGWTRADDVTVASSLRIIGSTLSRRSYDEAPVSPLFLFSRKQDFAYQQEVAGNPAKRHHVRFWRCPDDWLLPGGRRVEWLAAGTFDRAVGFSLFTMQITHKIDADTDVERDHIIATVREAVPSARVDVIRDFSTGYHSRNGGGDSITTDGDLPILDVRSDRRADREFLAARADRAVVAEQRAARADAAIPGAKRNSYENPLDLADRASGEVVRVRPSTITMGVVLLVIRVLAGGVWLVDLAVNWQKAVNDSIGTDDVDVASANVSLWIIAVLGVLGMLVQLSVVLFVYRGVNWARILVLLVSTMGIIVAATDFFSGGQQITVKTTLLTLSIDILILLALSSRSARAYSRRKNRPAPLTR